MDPLPQNSFIPNDAAQITRPVRAGGNGLADLATLISVVLLVASGALAVGVFLYSQYLQSSLKSKADQLERASAAFEPSLIQELTRLDDRMRIASEILGRHIAPTAFFRMLESTTIQTTSFRSLSFDTVENNTITIKMSGVADSVNSIAFQADLFSKIGMITSPIFSNIDRQPDGVRFDLAANINPTALGYAALVRGASSQLPPPQQQAPAQVAPAEEPSPFTAPQDETSTSTESSEGTSSSSQ